ncbi:MAG TPA: hypothetical protein VFE29_01080 [Terriglobia bacterium]|nr:hypothetical protein [Terriglobia bacterium]
MPETTRYMAAGILDTWVTHDWTHGIQVGKLPDFAEIDVQTENTLYEITVIDNITREVVVRGGRFFPEKTPARLAGSSLRGSFLKVGGIYVGFSMEILVAGKSVVTTPVRSIRMRS